jgi:hypothetical protein
VYLIAALTAVLLKTYYLQLITYQLSVWRESDCKLQAKKRSV